MKYLIQLISPPRPEFDYKGGTYYIHSIEPGSMSTTDIAFAYRFSLEEDANEYLKILNKRWVELGKVIPIK